MPIPEEVTMELTFYIPNGDKMKKTRTINTTLKMTDCMYDSIMKLANPTEKKWPLGSCANPDLFKKSGKWKSFERPSSQKDTVINVLSNHGYISHGELEKNVRFFVYFEDLVDSSDDEN